jgi:hypothetical protein
MGMIYKRGISYLTNDGVETHERLGGSVKCMVGAELHLPTFTRMVPAHLRHSGSDYSDLCGLALFRNGPWPGGGSCGD